MRTEENVFRFLDRIRANGKEIPSLRAIRSEVGGGSLSTISKAVNDWKVANQSSTADPHTLPVTLSEEQLKLLGDSIWNAFRPLLAAKITNLKAEPARSSRTSFRKLRRSFRSTVHRSLLMKSRYTTSRWNLKLPNENRRKPKEHTKQSRHSEINNSLTDSLFFRLWVR